MNINSQNRESQKRLFFNIVIFLLIFFIAIRIPLDSDFWWHIRSGQLSVESGRVVMEDMTSFTMDGAGWINHSWLAQILFYYVFQNTGNTGVSILVAVMATLSMFFVYIRLRGHPLIKGFVILLGVLTTAVIWSPRPQLFSLLLFSVLAFFVYEGKFSNRWKFVILFGFLFLVWGNLHAGFSLGIIFLILYALGKLVDNCTYPDLTNHSYLKDIIFYGFLIGISSLIVMINPNGINIWKVQFDTISIPSLQNMIPEWASPNFHELYQQPFLWLWILLVFFVFVNRTKYSFSEFLPLLFFGAIGFIARRNYVYFAVLAIPLLNNELNIFIKSLKRQKLFSSILNMQLEKFNKPPKNTLVSKIINLAFVGLLLFFVVGKIIVLGSDIIFLSYEKQSFPTNALGFISLHDVEKLRCLNSYAWGGYISWINPEMKIFIDGRTDLYGEEIILDWLTMVNSDTAWEGKMEEYEINCVLLEPNYPIVEDLIEQDWILIYQDQLSVLLLKDL